MISEGTWMNAIDISPHRSLKQGAARCNTGFICENPVRRQAETESGSAQGGIVVRSNGTAMPFDYRSADRQAHAHTGILRGEETFKQTGEMCRINSRAAVVNAAAHCPRIRQYCSNKNPPTLGSRLRHRLNRIDGEVDDHLLELGAVAVNLRERRFQIERDRDTFRLELMAEEDHRLRDDIVERKARSLGSSSGRHGADAVDDLGRSPRIGD